MFEAVVRFKIYYTEWKKTFVGNVNFHIVYWGHCWKKTAVNSDLIFRLFLYSNLQHLRNKRIRESISSWHTLGRREAGSGYTN